MVHIEKYRISNGLIVVGSGDGGPQLKGRGRANNNRKWFLRELSLRIPMICVPEDYSTKIHPCDLDDSTLDGDLHGWCSMSHNQLNDMMASNRKKYGKKISHQSPYHGYMKPFGKVYDEWVSSDTMPDIGFELYYLPSTLDYCRLHRITTRKGGQYKVRDDVHHVPDYLTLQLPRIKLPKDAIGADDDLILRPYHIVRYDVVQYLWRHQLVNWTKKEYNNVMKTIGVQSRCLHCKVCGRTGHRDVTAAQSIYRIFRYLLVHHDMPPRYSRPAA